MNILISMPKDGQSDSYIINAFQDMGHEVFFVDHRVQLENCIQHLPAFIKENKIDMMLVLYLVPGKTYDAEFLKNLKMQFPHIKYVSWIFDTTIDGKLCDQNKQFVDLMKEYDYFFTVCRGQVESFRKQGVNAFFLQEGFCQYTYDLTDKFPKKYDVSFMGQVGDKVVQKERFGFLERIVNIFDNTIIYGPVLGPIDSIVKHHKLRPTLNDIEHSRVVAQSRINIGLSGWPEIDGYFSARNYRIMGSGGFLLCNHSKNIEEFFVPDKEIVLYEDIKDCIDKIKYYLSHEEERNEIAKNGKKRVVTSYLFKDSLTKMLEIVK
jgi:spore maturation protein CgeB